MNIPKLLFSFKGSISRFEYLAGIGIATIVFAAWLALPGYLIGHNDPATYNDLSNVMKLLKAILYLSCMIPATICGLALAAKRLRNLEWSQWCLIAYFIPLANLFLLLVLLFKPGKTIIRNYN